MAKTGIEACTEILMQWAFLDMDDPAPDGTKYVMGYDELYQPAFRIISMIGPKLKMFLGIEFNWTVGAASMLEYCFHGNPGMSQVIMKEFLNSIEKRKPGQLQKGNYKFTSEDFGFAFPGSFPYLGDEKIAEKYLEKWDAQKDRTRSHGFTDNLCDTKEWWAEIFER